MADFDACIVEALDAGEIDAEVGAAARETYAEAKAALTETLGPIEADRQAAARVLKSLEEAAKEKERRARLAIRARRSVLEKASEFKAKRG